ncbi:MAG: sigma-70 family RNA polymerase sigma factor [Flavihumibacter sp.]
MQIRLGNIKSFDALFERYWEWAYAEAFKRTKNPEDAKDIVQDIFADLWRRRESLDIQHVHAYLQVSVRNRVLKLLRKKSVQHSFFDFFQHQDQVADKADLQVLWKEFAASFDHIVDALPPKRRKIFRLHFMQEVPFIDIACQMGVSQKTVQNQFTRAMAAVKTSLARFGLLFLFLVY